MGMLATPNLGLPYPDDNELLQDVPDFVRVLALALDKGKVVPTFASATARTTGIPAPVAGAICWMTDATPVPRLLVHDGSAWVRVYPPPVQVSTGSAVPTGTAEAGSLYVQY